MRWGRYGGALVALAGGTPAGLLLAAALLAIVGAHAQSDMTSAPTGPAPEAFGSERALPGQSGYVVDTLGVVYRAEADGTEVTPVDAEELARLEKLYRRTPRNVTRGLALARAYLRNGYSDDAVRVLGYHAGRRGSPAEVFVLLGALHFERGEYLRAEVVTRAGLERHPDALGLTALSVRARTRRGEFDGDLWAIRHLVEGASAVGLQCVALAAFEAGDLVTGLLAAEATYFTAGYSAMTPAIRASVDLAYDAFVRAAARGAPPVAHHYPAGTFEADYYAALLAAVGELVQRLPQYASRLELVAAIRIRTLEHYRERQVASDATAAPADPLVADLLARAWDAHEVGLLRWYTMASLRELNRHYFSAAVREAPDEWARVQERFEEFQL